MFEYFREPFEGFYWVAKFILTKFVASVSISSKADEYPNPSKRRAKCQKGNVIFRAGVTKIKKKNKKIRGERKEGRRDSVKMEAERSFFRL